MLKHIKRLGSAELEIMQILWSADGPVTSTWIHDKLMSSRTWPLSTLMTSLSRLADKGFVHCDRSTRSNLYSALVSENAYRQDEGASFLSRVYGNSLQNFVASLYDARAITKDDIVELRAYLDELERKSDDQ